MIGKPITRVALLVMFMDRQDLIGLVTHAHSTFQNGEDIGNRVDVWIMQLENARLVLVFVGVVVHVNVKLMMIVKMTICVV
jgi:hypothetical protein